MKYYSRNDKSANCEGVKYSYPENPENPENPDSDKFHQHWHGKNVKILRIRKILKILIQTDYLMVRSFIYPI